MARERMAGWREGMDEAGLPKREPLIGLWKASWGYVAGQRLVEEGLPDAIMCANDEVAVGLLHVFAEAGVSVPGDVSVAGFDDVPLAAYVGRYLRASHPPRCVWFDGGVRPLRSLFFCVPCVRGDMNAHSTDVCRRSGRSVNGRSPEMRGCR